MNGYNSPSVQGSNYEQQSYLVPLEILPVLDAGDGDADSVDFSDISQIMQDYMDQQQMSPCVEMQNELTQGINEADSVSPYIGQWKAIENLRENGSQTVKNEIDLIWTEAPDSMFTLSFRKRFSQVLEELRWDLVNPHDASDSTVRARSLGFALRLYSEIQQALNTFNSSPDSPGSDGQQFGYLLRRWCDKLVDPLVNNLEIAQGIQSIMEKERKILAQSQPIPSVVHTPHYLNMKMEADDHLPQVYDLATELDQLEKNYQNSARVIENLLIRVQKLQLNVAGELRVLDHFDTRGLDRQQKVAFENVVTNRNHVVQELLIVLKTQHFAFLEKLKSILAKVMDDEIREFKRNQAYINNGKVRSHHCTLQQLQDWYKRLSIIVKGNLHLMGKLQFIGQQLGLDAAVQRTDNIWQGINELIETYSIMIIELVQNGLIVDVHPQQVLMKDKRFHSTLRHLVGDALDIHQINFRVKACLIEARQVANVMHNGPSSPFEQSGKILNNEADSDYITSSGVLSVNMRNMCLKMQQRGTQRMAEMVAKLKVAMLYRAEITVRFPSHQKTLVAQALSLPIVVISHGKQEADAQATIFWDNAFAKSVRLPFVVDDPVPWDALLDALDGRWKKECEEGPAGTGRTVGLSDEARQYLTMKLFHKRDVQPGMTVAWEDFNHGKKNTGARMDQKKEPFTFWSWFYSAMKLCSSRYLRKFWNLGYIHGFLSKSGCQDKLLNASRRHHPGLFLFRFSETQQGAISISHTVVENDRIQVRNLEPDSVKNFEVRSLPNTVKDLDYLTFLYKTSGAVQQKDDAFGSYYTSAVQSCDPRSDYVPKEYKVSVLEPQRHFPGDRGPDTPSTTLSFSADIPFLPFSPPTGFTPDHRAGNSFDEGVGDSSSSS